MMIRKDVQRQHFLCGGLLSPVAFTLGDAQQLLGRMQYHSKAAILTSGKRRLPWAVLLDFHHCGLRALQAQVLTRHNNITATDGCTAHQNLTSDSQARQAETASATAAGTAAAEARF